MADRKHPILKPVLLSLTAVLVFWYLLCLPRNLFKGTPYSTVVQDRSGALMGARIAADGQWRFPPCDTVPERYAKALIQFEDKYFRWHPGVNPVAIVRAAAGNLKAGHVTSGGSTLTMQVIRLSRHRERTLWQKAVESVLATRLELRMSKKKILALYASHAPFGGNVVGLEAASWRYFGRPAAELSWGEAATLAILPNAPSSIHPGRNRDLLLAKRNRLLTNLRDRGELDSLTCYLACEEPLPLEPLPLPAYAPHLTEWYAATRRGEQVRTEIDLPLQRRVEAMTDRWSDELDRTGIQDLAAVVLDIPSGEVIAYVGNASQHRSRPGRQVDIARAPRSTGSILKPLLYCALLQEGSILPNTLLPDVPINLNGFSPQNFDLQFYGAVPAAEALARSLNVPAVHMLRDYGVPKFQELLRNLGMSTLTRDPSDYGLSLILGGAEGTLLDITRIYGRLSRCYQGLDTCVLHDRTALWYTFDALKEVSRPDELDWRLVRSVRKVAWKTGTSYGFRDAWAVGVTPEYAVGVWVGNAQGQGVPGLTGARTAGPVLFDLLGLLPRHDRQQNAYAADGWFLPPVYGEYITAEVCPESGHLRGLACERADTLMLPRTAQQSAPCPYHQIVDGESRFLLPPRMEWFYRQHHPEYRPLSRAQSDRQLEFIYPEPGSTITLPRQLDGSPGSIVFNLAHRDPSVQVFWHLDNEYVGETRLIHQLSLSPPPGQHSMTAVDEQGNVTSVRFTVVRY